MAPAERAFSYARYFAMEEHRLRHRRFDGAMSEEIDRAEDMYRARDKERFRKQIETGDIRAARDRILTTPERLAHDPS